MTTVFNDNETILGRGEINDIDAILAIPVHDPTEVEHIVKNNADSIFTWDYSLARPALRKLYEKATTGQWNGTTDLPWDTDVDVEKVVAADQEILGTGLDANLYIGTPSRSGATRSGSSSASRVATGRSASSSTASRAR